ncbi:unnamed protein product [Psylliodes chrysocephalus]|uniref:Uncharacterized protein n=1 Tax=Psylliodes chrysocephalus TaxID=3402493 RepID=A0A9P0D0Z2_9CUCU|nr:unnamed protein product [Psylliodes chrysocephala]
MSSEIKCFCCKVVCDATKVVNCSICENSFKHTCVGLTFNDLTRVAKNGVAYTCPNCLVVSAEINELRSVIVELKKEVTELKESLSTRNTVTPSNIEGMSLNNIVNEVYERQKRQRNLLLFNAQNPKREMLRNELNLIIKWSVIS